MLDVVWLIPALPLAGFLIIMVLGRRLGEPKAGYLATMMCRRRVRRHGRRVLRPDVEDVRRAASHQDAVHLAAGRRSLKVDLAFLVDPLSITMALFITGIGTLIHLYSIGYMHGDPKFSKFFLYLKPVRVQHVDAGARREPARHLPRLGRRRHVLVPPDQLLARTGETAATAGKKAFITNRVGDFGFMMAMFVAFKFIGSLSYDSGINHAADSKDRSRHRGHGHRVDALRRCLRQERPAAAVPVAARCHGGPDACVGADPCGHDGHRPGCT